MVEFRRTGNIVPTGMGWIISTAPGPSRPPGDVNSGTFELEGSECGCCCREAAGWAKRFAQEFASRKSHAPRLKIRLDNSPLILVFYSTTHSDEESTFGIVDARARDCSDIADDLVRTTSSGVRPLFRL